jgi:hypothetical protein
MLAEAAVYLYTMMVITLGRRGGVVTQSSAKARTPVRTRSVPPFIYSV